MQDDTLGIGRVRGAQVHPSCGLKSVYCMHILLIWNFYILEIGQHFRLRMESSTPFLRLCYYTHLCSLYGLEFVTYFNAIYLGAPFVVLHVLNLKRYQVKQLSNLLKVDNLIPCCENLSQPSAQDVFVSSILKRMPHILVSTNFEYNTK